jgi:hypothetical protein
MGNRSQVSGGQPAGVDGARNQRTVAPGIPHSLQIAAGKYAATREQPNVGQEATERLEQTQIDSAPGTDTTQVQHEDRGDTRARSLLRQAHRIGACPPGVLQCVMKDRIAKPKIEAEHHAGRSHDTDDRA